MAFERPRIIRPPSEWKSYFLPLTRGCSNNTCAFCGYYGSRLSLRPLEDVQEEIDALALFMNSRFYHPAMPAIVYEIARSWDGKRVFLQDGDALVYPFQKLVMILERLNERFPSLQRIGTYATPQDILRRNLEELEELKRLKLCIFYQGVESGDDDVLKRVNKGVNHDQMAEAGRRVKEAGITLSVTVILGLGERDGSEKHALETARVLTEIDPDYGGALTLTLVSNTPLCDQWNKDEFSPLSPFESLEELKMIIENSRFTECFFSSMHASNYLALRGRLPYDQERMLGELDEILEKRDPSLLRPDFMRGL